MNFSNTHAFFNSPNLAPISLCEPFYRPRVYLHLIFYQMDDFLATSWMIYLPKSFPFLLKNDCHQFFKSKKNHSSTILPIFIFLPPRSPLHLKRVWHSIKPKYGFRSNFYLRENVALPGVLTIPFWDYQIPFTNPDRAFGSTPVFTTVPRWDISPKKC